MDEQQFTDILAGLDESAADVAAVAPDDAAPILDSPPSEEPEAPSPAAETAPVPPTQDVGTLEAPPEEAAAPQWDSEQNPYFQAYQQWQAHAQQLEQQQQAYLAQQQQQQAYLAQQQAAAQWKQDEQFLRDLTAGDLEAYDRTQAIIQSRVQPLQQQAHQLWTETTQAQKVASAIHIAATSLLSQDQQNLLNAEIQRLMSLPSPDQMVADVQYRKQVTSQRETELERMRRENEELKKYITTQQAARTRRMQGADAVDMGGVSAGTRSLADAEDFDSFFDALIGAA